MNGIDSLNYNKNNCESRDNSVQRRNLYEIENIKYNSNETSGIYIIIILEFQYYEDDKVKSKSVNTNLLENEENEKKRKYMDVNIDNILLKKLGLINTLIDIDDLYTHR